MDRETSPWAWQEAQRHNNEALLTGSSLGPQASARDKVCALHMELFWGMPMYLLDPRSLKDERLPQP